MTGRISLERVSCATLLKRDVRKVTVNADTAITNVVAIGTEPGLDKALKPEMPYAL